jgi:hypothetical protein
VKEKCAAAWRETLFGSLPAAQRVAPVVIAERLRQHAIKTLLDRLTERLDADRHALASLRRIGRATSLRQVSVQQKCVPFSKIGKGMHHRLNRTLTYCYDTGEIVRIRVAELI